jgi:hypothetical protein
MNLKMRIKRYIKEIILFIDNFLIFYNFKKVEYNFSSKINFDSYKANQYLKKKLKKSKLYLEYRTGNSTIYAEKKKINYISIESKKDIFENLKYKKKMNIYFYSLGITKRYSVPYFIQIKKKKIMNYVNAIQKINIIPDLILIDGRFRVLCFFYVMKFLKLKKADKTIILIDDFHRKEYSLIKNYFKFNFFGRIGSTKLSNQKKSFNLNKITGQFLRDPS